MGSGHGTPPEHLIHYALGALHAFEATGQIDQNSAALWHKRFQAQLVTERSKSHGASAQSALESSDKRPAIFERMEEPDDFSESAFVMSLTGPPDHVQTTGGLLRITAIEIYDGGLLIHWILKLAPHLEPYGILSRKPSIPMSERQKADEIIFEAIPHFEATDDSGTRFIESQSQWAGTTTLHGNAWFLPGLAASAKILQFEGTGWRLMIKLPRNNQK